MSAGAASSTAVGPPRAPLGGGPLDLRSGLRCALFVIVPLAIGFALGQIVGGVIATLGAVNLLLVDSPLGQPTTRVRTLAVALVANALAFGLGTVVTWLPQLSETILIGTIVAAILYVATRLGAPGAGTTVAILFVVPIGLPGGGLDDAALRTGLILAGGGCALIGAMLPRWWPGLASTPRGPPRPIPVLDAAACLPYAVAVGATVALGFVVAHQLDLGRDFWVMLTVLVALRPDLAGTFSLATQRIAGTIAGAAIAYGITVSTSSFPILLATLAFATALTFATRTMNYVVFATALTVFVICLLNLAYSGGPTLALDRIEDTVLGGALAVATGAVLTYGLRVHRAPPGAAPASRA